MNKNKNLGILARLLAIPMFVFGCVLNASALTTTWDGSSSTIWTDPTNWDNGVPGAGDDVIINSTGYASAPTISTNVVINSLSISTDDNGGVLTIANGASLSVSGNGTPANGDVTVGTNGKLLLQGTATATVTDDISGTGTLEAANSSSGSFTIAGDFRIGNFSAGDYTQGTFSVIFNGSSAEVIDNPSGSYFFNNLVINNTGSGVTLMEDVEIDLDLTGTGTFIADNGGGGNGPGGEVVILLLGDMTVANFTHNSSSILWLNALQSLNSTTQSIGSTNGYTFYDVINQNDSTTLINGNMTVVNNFDFDQGKFILGNFNVTMDSSATITDITIPAYFFDVSGDADYDSTMYFVTNGASGNNGFLTMPVPTGVTGREFPVGPSAASNDYNPLTMKHSAGVDVNFDIKVFKNVSDDDGTDLDTVSIDRTWLAVQHSGGGLSSVTSTHQWYSTQQNTNFDRDSTYISYRTIDPTRDGAGGTSAWSMTQLPGSSSGGDPYLHVSGAIGDNDTMADNTKYFLAIGSGTPKVGDPLPVTWLSFDASYSNRQANLNWKTATEVNNSHFEVQRSTDGKTWNTVGRVEGRGNSKIVNAYTFTDKSAGNLNLNTIYYRLKQVDYNGKFGYSAIKVVRPSAEPVIEAYPNPATDRINISAEVSGSTSIQLLSANGMPVYTEQFNATGKVQKVINLQACPKGMYFVRIVSEAGATTKTIYKN